MKIAIVILNWNGRRLLEQFLPNIVLESSLDYADIYVVDNGSTDDSIEFINRNFPEVTIIKNSINEGYAAGYNKALASIQADVFALVNSDIQVTKDWLAPVHEIFSTQPNTGIVQPKILDFKNPLKFEYAGAGGGYIDALGYPYCRGRVFQTLENDNGQYNDEIDIFWASGACLFIRSELFFKANGFDESYFAHQEEIDLCWRVKHMGNDIKYSGKSEVYHIGGATLEESNPKKTYLNFRNSLFSLVKNLPSGQLIKILLLRLILDGIAGIKFTLELRPVHAFAIMKAHFSFYGNLSQLIRKRRLIKPLNHNVAVKSIVWRYFILGKTKFKDL